MIPSLKPFRFALPFAHVLLLRFSQAARLLVELTPQEGFYFSSSLVSPKAADVENPKLLQERQLGGQLYR